MQRPASSSSTSARERLPGVPVGLSRRRLLGAGAALGASVAVSPALTRSASAAARCEPRYLGSRPGDERLPYAKYLKAKTDPPQAQVLEALAAGPLPVAQVPARSTVAGELTATGYSAVETGYGRGRSGELWIACLTRMPRVTPEMWDWWFGWHSKESARYRLWHPSAHGFSALRFDRSETPGLTDRQRYRGNTSYVDEFIGPQLQQLAIAFKEPAALGIDESRSGGTVICGTVGSSVAPVNLGYLFHQVRRVPGGSEMRSRFVLNVPGVARFDASAAECAVARGLVVPRQVVFDHAFGAHLLRHCGEEMNHLAQFLPELHAEFAGTST